MNLIACSSLFPNTDTFNDANLGDGLISFRRNDGIFLTPTVLNPPFLHYGNGIPRIQLGTGSDAENLNSYKLSTQVSTGWTLGTTTRATYFTSTPTRKMISTLTRFFSNNTGSSTTITEAGVESYLNWYGNQGYVLFVRDLLASPITVAAGETITFNYNFELSYPNP